MKPSKRSLCLTLFFVSGALVCLFLFGRSHHGHSPTIASVPLVTQSQQPSFEIKAPPDLEKVRSSVSITHSDVTVPDLVPNSPKRFLDLIDDTRPSKNLAAKAGVIQLTRTMAIELAPHGILVNCVAPGSTLTEGTRALFYGEDATMRDRRERMLSHVPLARPGTTEEIASAVLFFAAPDASYITGQTLCVDGGWTAGGFFRDF